MTTLQKLHTYFKILRKTWCIFISFFYFCKSQGKAFIPGLYLQNFRILFDMRLSILTTLPILLTAANAYGLTVDFTAKEAATTYYNQGFDSTDEFNSWELKSTNSSPECTWHLTEKPYVKGLPAFSAFESDSKMSLAIRYNDTEDQHETITSPVVEIQPNSSCEFYACFSGGLLVFAHWSLWVTDMTDNSEHELLNAFRWAQEVGFDGPNWIPFTADLSQFEGKDVRFSFKYDGQGGEDVLIDGFKVAQADTSEEARVSIHPGESVHFTSLTEGATEWNWTFEGGTPSSSSEANPTVTYSKAGVYSVSLTAGDGSESSTRERKGFVTVTEIAPKAIIGVPETGYLSPWIYSFVPVGVPVQFHDLSENEPTEWLWTFNGTDITESIEQHPTVTYQQHGAYSVGLRVTNSAGTSTDMLQNAIQAGGAQYIWNITPEENQSLAPISFPFFGYYGGTNALGLPAFAELFQAPAAKATISEVAVYFAVADVANPNAKLTVTVTDMNEKGLPGTTLASCTLTAADIQYSDTDFEETIFRFDSPVEIDDAFFITIDGLSADPDNTLAMFCSPNRGEGGKCTAYHLAEEWDENDQPTGKTEWFKGDEAVSFALTPLLDYGGSATVGQTAAPTFRLISSQEAITVLPGGTNAVITVYNLAGQPVKSACNVQQLSTADLPAGIYLVRATVGGQTIVKKIIR